MKRISTALLVLMAIGVLALLSLVLSGCIGQGGTPAEQAIVKLEGDVSAAKLQADEVTAVKTGPTTAGRDITTTNDPVVSWILAAGGVATTPLCFLIYVWWKKRDRRKTALMETVRHGPNKKPPTFEEKAFCKYCDPLKK